ncbi:MAG: dipicolinate synthase subunit B [Clostridia bacterium]
MNKNIGLCITGSFCTFKKILPEIKKLVEEGNNVFPVFSYNVTTTDTRFYIAKDFYKDVEEITGHKPITTITEAEQFGPKNKMDIMIIAPCTGNTLAKLNNAITDTPVLMAVKAHLRNNRPLLIAVSTNDGLSTNAKNIGEMLNKKNIYLVPFSQDNIIDKTNSLVAHFDLLYASVEAALANKQIQPVIVR